MDEHIAKNATLDMSSERGLATARLPIQEFTVAEKKYAPVLSIDQVRILACKSVCCGSLCLRSFLHC